MHDWKLKTSPVVKLKRPIKCLCILCLFADFDAGNLVVVGVVVVLVVVVVVFVVVIIINVKSHRLKFFPNFMVIL